MTDTLTFVKEKLTYHAAYVGYGQYMILTVKSLPNLVRTARTPLHLLYQCAFLIDLDTGEFIKSRHDDVDFDDLWEYIRDLDCPHIDEHYPRFKSTVDIMANTRDNLDTFTSSTF